MRKYRQGCSASGERTLRNEARAHLEEEEISHFKKMTEVEKKGVGLNLMVL